MTSEERVHAIMDFRFTERQARFLALVMRHAGVCVPRQYARFAGIAHGGGKCNAFFARLVRRGYAVESDCVHNRARLYRLHPERSAAPGSLVSVALLAYAAVMYATAVVGGKVVRFKLSPALARAHRQNRGKTMTEGDAVAFVATKRRARAGRRGTRSSVT